MGHHNDCPCEWEAQWDEREQQYPEPPVEDYCAARGHDLFVAVEEHIYATTRGQPTSCLCGHRDYSLDELIAIRDAQRTRPPKGQARAATRPTGQEKEKERNGKA